MTDVANQFRTFWQTSTQHLEQFASYHDQVLSRTDGVSTDPFPMSLVPAHPNQLQMGVEIRLPDEGYPHSTAPGAEDYRFDRPQPPIKLFRIPICLIQPLPNIDSSPLCKVYTSFLRTARQKIAQGTPASDLLGHDDIVIDLFFRSRRATDPFTATSWASEVVSHVSQLDDFVRLAWIVLLTLLMRWLLFPSEATYARVPEMMRPVCAQRLIPHRASIDLCPLPALRDSLVARFRDWVGALAHARCSVNWGGSMDDAVQRDEGTGQVRLTRGFREHAVRFENWSVSERILEAFPEVRGRMPVESSSPRSRKREREKRGGDVGGLADGDLDGILDLDGQAPLPVPPPPPPPNWKRGRDEELDGQADDVDGLFERELN